MILLSSSLVVNRSSSPECQLHLNSRYHANYLESPTAQNTPLLFDSYGYDPNSGLRDSKDVKYANQRS